MSAFAWPRIAGHCNRPGPACKDLSEKTWLEREGPTNATGTASRVRCPSNPNPRPSRGRPYFSFGCTGLTTD